MQTVGGGNDGRPLSRSMPAVARFVSALLLSPIQLSVLDSAASSYSSPVSCFPCVPFSSPESRSPTTTTATGSTHHLASLASGQFFEDDEQVHVKWGNLERMM